MKKYFDWLRDNWFLDVTLLTYTVLFFIKRPAMLRALQISASLFLLVLPIIVSVFILVGLFKVWVPEKSVLNHLGKGSGVKGLLLGALFGTLLHGPIFSYFPLFKSMMEKGARTAVIVAILATWAIKLPMIPLELDFLGVKFTLLQQGLVLLTAIPMGLLMEYLVEGRKQNSK